MTMWCAHTHMGSIYMYNIAKHTHAHIYYLFTVHITVWVTLGAVSQGRRKQKVRSLTVVQPGLLQRLGTLKHSFHSLRLSLSYTHPFFTPHLLYHKFPKGFVCLHVREKEGWEGGQGGETESLFHSAKDCDSSGCTVSGSAEFHDLRLHTVCV